MTGMRVMWPRIHMHPGNRQVTYISTTHTYHTLPTRSFVMRIAGARTEEGADSHHTRDKVEGH